MSDIDIIKTELKALLKKSLVGVTDEELDEMILNNYDTFKDWDLTEFRALADYVKECGKKTKK